MAEIVLEPEVDEILEPDISQLVTEDDTPVDNIFSEKQQRLLTEALYASWPGPPGAEKRPFIALANVGLFYSVGEPALVPDVLVSLDVQLPEDIWTKKHRSYFLWEYGKPPDVVIEIVSNREGGELTTKLNHYARIGIANYVVFDPIQQLSRKVLRFFERHRTGYVEVDSFWLPEIELGLTLWRGVFEDREDTWLRWYDLEGNILLTGVEIALQERERAELESERADQEREWAEQLAAQLRALGVEPEA